MIYRQLRQVGQTIEHCGTCTSRYAAGKGICADPGAAGLTDSAQHQAALSIHFAAADHNHAVLAGLQFSYSFIHAAGRHRRGRRHLYCCLCAVGVISPGHIRRQHQSGNLANACLTHRLCRVPGNIIGGFGRMHPV